MDSEEIELTEEAKEALKREWTEVIDAYDPNDPKYKELAKLAAKTIRMRHADRAMESNFLRLALPQVYGSREYEDVAQYYVDRELKPITEIKI